MSNLEITDSRAFVGINRLHVCEPDNRQTTVKAEEIMYHGRIQRKCVQHWMRTQQRLIKLADKTK